MIHTLFIQFIQILKRLKYDVILVFLATATFVFLFWIKLVSWLIKYIKYLTL